MPGRGVKTEKGIDHDESRRRRAETTFQDRQGKKDGKLSSIRTDPNKIDNGLAKIDNGELIFTGTIFHEQGFAAYENPNGTPMQGLYYQINFKEEGLLFITYLIENPAPVTLLVIVEYSNGEKIQPEFKSMIKDFQSKNGFTDKDINTMGWSLLTSTLQKGFISDVNKQLLLKWINYGYSKLNFYISAYPVMVSISDILLNKNPQTQENLLSALIIPDDNKGGSQSRRKTRKTKTRKPRKTKTRRKTKRRKVKKTKKRH
jgi:hypothetical protein